MENQDPEYLLMMVNYSQMGIDNVLKRIEDVKISDSSKRS